MSEPGQDVVRVAAEEVAPEFSRFMGTVVGSPSFELSELMGDQVRFWRFKRSLKHAKKAKVLLDDAGLEPHAVPFRTLVPLLESASLEDDGDLTDRWASLLANASGEHEVPVSFPNILRELEPVQAVLLDSVYDIMMQMVPELWLTRGIFTPGILDLDESAVHFHIDNLARLRLVRGLYPEPERHYELITLTHLGKAFVRACRPPNQPDPAIKYADAASADAFVAENKKRRAAQTAAEWNQAAQRPHAGRQS